MWRLFRLFNKHGFKYTLYAVGQALEMNPAVARSSVENGHDVASHCYRCVHQYMNRYASSLTPLQLD